MEASLHPTEVCKSLSSSPLLSEEPIYPIPTCRRPPLGLSSSVSLFPTSLTHHLTPFYTDPSRMDTDEDGVTDYIELKGWDVIVIHERRGEVMEDRCEYGVWSLPIRYDSEGDGASDETEWKFHGDPDSSDSDKDGIPDSEESGPNLTMVEGTPPVILDKKGRDKSSEKYSGAYIKTKVKIKTKWSISGVKIKGKIIVIFTVVDNAGLDRAVIYVQTGGERIIYLGGDKRREIEEVFDIGDLLRLIHGGYDVRVNVTDINGNWATGKTHIDSALQTLKKGLSALLDMIVAVLKVIAKVASMLLDVIKSIVMRMLEPVLKPVKGMIKNLIQKVSNALGRNSYLMSIFSYSPLEKTRFNIHSEEIKRTIALIGGFISTFILFTAVIFRVIEAAEISTKTFTAAISNLATILVKHIKPIIMRAILGGLVLGTLPLIKEIIDGKKPRDSISNFLSKVGLTTSTIGVIKDLYDAIKELRENGLKSKLGLKMLGLGIAIIGAIITVFSILDPDANNTSLILLDVFGFITSILGLFLFKYGEKESKEKVIGSVADITATLEKIIAYASPVAAGIAILAHWRGGEYSEK